jgi:murein DD-endopeptidase MepM/ murein hydrolase activator NlpD
VHEGRIATQRRTVATSNSRSAHIRWLVTGFFLPLIGGAGVFGLLRQPNNVRPFQPESSISLSLQTPPATKAADAPEPTIAPIIGDAIDFVVRRNDTLEQIFRKLRINLDDLATIRNLPGVRENLDFLKPGELISVTHIDGVLLRLVRRVSETETLSVSRDDTGFAAQVVTTPLEIRTVAAHGVIDSSLFVSGRAAGISSDVILRLANDIFGWDIDFALEIQPDDEFTVIYEQKYRDGAYLSDGRILAAEFVNAGRVYRAVRYESADGQITDYYTPDGKSMRKQFLRAPVDFKYISSNFNPRRFHPVLNITRAHQGVDYAAPTGTPIKASGDGRASFVGVKGGYGKAIVLEHGGGVSTLYGHLSRYAKDLRNGTRVKQGDIIGYVGSTGTATAAHLHYEYRINSIHKNPRTIALPDAKPIPPSYLIAFEAASAPFLTQLDRSKAAQIAATPAR